MGLAKIALRGFIGGATYTIGGFVVYALVCAGIEVAYKLKAKKN